MEIPRPSRVCSVSFRDFLPGEHFFSVLIHDNGVLVRKDICAEHWSVPPPDCYGWWKSTVKHVAEHASQQATGETLQNLFERLTTQPGEADALYVLTLLMLRRKMLRFEKDVNDEQGNKRLEVYAFHTNMTYQIPVSVPSHERLEEIQRQLG